MGVKKNPARGRRILAMQLIKKAWNKVRKHYSSILRYFTKKLCCINGNGAYDDLICPKKFDPGEYTIYYSLDASAQVHSHGQSGSSPDSEAVYYDMQEMTMYAVMEEI